MIGIPFPGFEELVAVNANGDSCDIYSNIFLDPLFYSTTGDSAYYLAANSPCIDAGDPNSPPDPDWTVADIGALYFDQSGLTPVAVTLTPFNPPIVLPGSGGTFEFNIEVANNDTVSWTFDLWTMATLPDGREYGPIIGPINLTLDPGVSVNRDRTQAVGFGAPAGVYTYDAYVGTYPDDIIDEDHFEFEKLAQSDGGPIVPEWDNWGESFADEFSCGSLTSPAEFALHRAYPNPFNPEANLTFALKEAGYTTLVVYNIEGKEIARLADGWYAPGLHEVTFDGSQFSSGVYFARLSSGSFCQSQKMILTK